MKKVLIFLVCIVVGSAFAETKNITWKANGTTYATSTCEVGGDLIIPQTNPTKYGYHFVGWLSSYIFLEYIESTGEQYIDTGVWIGNPTDLIGTTVDFMATSFVGNSAMVCGAVVDDGTNKYTNTQAGVYKTSFMNSDFGFTYSQNNIYSRTIARCNGKGSATPNSTFIIFGRNRDTLGPQPYGGVRIWDVKIYKNNSLVRHLVPAKNAAGTVGMFDTVSSDFFTNAGTGEFIAGPEIQ